MGGEETAVTAVRTIEDVQSDDAAFRAAEAVAPPMIPAEEGAALKGMLSDAGTCDRCGRCLLYTSPSPRDQRGSRMPSSA